MDNSNDYGFTLAEILGVIVIIGLLLVIIGPLVVNRIKDNNDTVSLVGDSIIFEAASQYDDENPDTNNTEKRCIPIKTLIEYGKLTSPVKDFKTGEEIDDKSVLITHYKSGYRDFKILSGEDCSQEQVTSISSLEPEINIDNACSKGYISLVFDDRSGTGIAGYAVTTSEVSDDKIDWTDLGAGQTSVEYIPSGDDEKIFIYVKDNAGNIGKKTYFFQGKHTITFDPNGGTVDPTSKIVYKYKTYGELPIPKKDLYGLDVYTFDGWYTEKDGGKKITSDDMFCLDSDQTLYAHYKSKYFQIRSYLNCNKLLDLNGGHAVNGEKIQLWEYSNSNAQRWHIQKNSDGSVTFKSNANQNYCLDVPHGDVIESYKNNTPLELYDCNNSDAQKFVIDKNSDYFVIKTKKNSRYCVDVANANTSNGTGLLLWECNGGFNQRWFLNDSCDSNVKAPTCSIELNGVRGEDNWFRSNVVVSLKTGVDYSKLDSYGLSTSSKTANKVTSLTHSSDTSGTVYYGIARNKSGNIECSVVVKKDTAPPEISYGYLDNSRFESIPYGGGRYFNFYYRDYLSGLLNTEVPFEAYSYLTQSFGGSAICNSGWRPAGGTLCSDSQNNRANQYYRGYRVKDKAGNVSNIVCSYLSTSGSYSQSGPSNPCNANGTIFRND